MIVIEPNTCMITDTLVSAINLNQDTLLDAYIEVNEPTKDLRETLLITLLVCLEFNKSMGF